MDTRRRLSEACSLMDAFVRTTGMVDSTAPPRRYLWTDAFAVCNLLELFSRTREDRYRELAVTLVETVHTVLGRHRSDDSRCGWISGLGEAEGREHPVAGGLRIGKPLPERPVGGTYDAGTEWDRDGQYYHYLTKWMHALGRMAAVLGDERFATLAIELGRAAHRGFLQPASSGRPAHLAWKMSIDLSRPLVPAAGQHDPLDGLVTYLEIAGGTQALAKERADLARMCEVRDWVTVDPLGLGGLLFDAARLVQLGRAAPAGLAVEVLSAACRGLDGFARSNTLREAPAHRLAFRELGLSIGLHALDGVIRGGRLDDRGRALIAQLESFYPLATVIEACWLDPVNRATPVWRDHEDINAVMLATTLIPEGFLRI